MAPAARLRGASAGALTAALTVVAHATGGGGLPSGPAAALLLLFAVTTGALAAAMRAGSFGRLLTLLAVGQLVGHAILSAAGHSHPSTLSASWGAMLAAHVVAVTIGAGLITVGSHLCDAVSRVLRTAAPPIRRPIPSLTTVAGRGSDQPLRSALLLAASVSHRGPPVSLAR